MKNNYHTHCHYCDGKVPMQTMIEKAVALGFNQLGFSSHAPLGYDNNFAITDENLPHYVDDIDRFQKIYPNIQLLKGLECDYIPTLTRDFIYYKEKYHLDYIIGGIHLVKKQNDEHLWFIDGSKREIYLAGLANIFNNNIREAVTCFWEQTFEMLETQQLDIIAHIDKIKMHNRNEFFKEDEKWYVILVDHALQLIKKQGVIVEINPRGLYKGRCQHFYPSDYILREIKRLDIPMVVSSDAHKDEELTLFQKEAYAKLKAFNIRIVELAVKKR